MPELKNPRHEDFCRHRAAGKTKLESYRLAGYKKSNTDRQRAHDLSTKPYIIQRLEELGGVKREVYDVTVESMAKEFDEAADFAKACNNPGALVAARNSKAKLFGLMTDRSVVSVTHNYALMSEEELRFEIAAIHAEVRTIKAGVRH